MKKINKILFVFLIVLTSFIFISIDVKADTKNNKASLKKISIRNVTLNPKFDPDVYNYTASVNYLIDNVTINTSANGSKTKVEGDGLRTLEVGSNEIKIVVTAEDGSSSTYTITITRKEENAEDEEETDEYGVPIYRVIEKDKKPINYHVDCKEWDVAHQAWVIITILGPFLYIIFAAFDFYKIVMAGGEEEIKKAKKLIPKRLIIFLLFIIIPVLVSVILKFAAGSAGNTALLRCIINGG